MMNKELLPKGSLGRLLQRRDDLSHLKFNPEDDQSSVRSELSCPVTTDWSKDKQDNLLKKLVG